MAVRPECFRHVRSEQGDTLDGEKRHQTLCTKWQPHGNVHATEFKAPKQRDFQCVRLGPADAWVTLQATPPHFWEENPPGGFVSYERFALFYRLGI